jgi:hypothetical protein
MICSLLKPPMEIAMVGQWDAHMPHPLHDAEMVSAFFFFPTLTVLIAA